MFSDLYVSMIKAKTKTKNYFAFEAVGAWTYFFFCWNNISLFEFINVLKACVEHFHLFWIIYVCTHSLTIHDWAAWTMWILVRASSNKNWVNQSRKTDKKGQRTVKVVWFISKCTWEERKKFISFCNKRVSFYNEIFGGFFFTSSSRW